MTALGMVIGTSSLILVVTIALTGKQYVLAQIENIGTNLVWVEYRGLVNAGANATVKDYITFEDMVAVQQQVPEVKAATPVLNLHERISRGGGKEVDVLILGVDPSYQQNSADGGGRRAGFLTTPIPKCSTRFAWLRRSTPNSTTAEPTWLSGHTIKIAGVPFVIIGAFRESMETFGRSEIQNDTILIPYTVARRLTGTKAINQIYFTMFNSESVPAGNEGHSAGHQVAASPGVAIQRG